MVEVLVLEVREEELKWLEICLKEGCLKEVECWECLCLVDFVD